MGVIIHNSVGSNPYWGTLADSNYAGLASYLDGGGILFKVTFENSGGGGGNVCCGANIDMGSMQTMFNTWLGSNHGLSGITSGNSHFYYARDSLDIADLSQVSGTTLDYSGVAGKKYQVNASGGINLSLIHI